MCVSDHEWMSKCRCVGEEAGIEREMDQDGGGEGGMRWVDCSLLGYSFKVTLFPSHFCFNSSLNNGMTLPQIFIS